MASDITAPRLISVGGATVSVTVLFFPLSYLLGDILTEVYGYAQARRVAWWCVLASVVSGCLYQGVLAFPSADAPLRQDAYKEVLGAVPRTLIGGWVALWSGMAVNNYVMAKLKVVTGGRHLWLRAVTSTIGGELVNTTVFYVVALGGLLPPAALVAAILVGSGIKIGVEIVMLPVTYLLVGRIKAAEGLSYFDDTTNVNPFLLKGAERHGTTRAEDKPCEVTLGAESPSFAAIVSRS